jgi:predicted dienelactone hydrolase
MNHIQTASLLVAASLLTAACGDDSTATGSGGSASASTGSDGSGGEASSAGGGGSGPSSTGTEAGPGGSTSASTSSAGGGGSSSSSSGTGGGGAVDDPNLDGPFTVGELTATADSSSGNDVPLHAFYPTAGPVAGPYPVVVIGHGFQLPASQYTSYARRLATHGFVAMTNDFDAGFSPNNVDNANDMLAGLDWAAAEAALAGIADANNAGMSGHSLGGKVALLAASYDARVKASITLDPVDGAMNCNPTDCPDVSNLMPLAIPTGFLGETIDASGGFFGACAPAADNFTTFYAGTTSPSLSVTITGANHMSFLDDVAGCGITCTFCNAATAPDATVNSLAKAYVVAFYRRHLKGEAAYDSFLTGADAQARYVDTGLATIQSK